MYLSDWNSVTDAIEWLIQINDDRWSWRSVLEQFSKTDPDTVAVVLRVGTKLIRLGSGDVHEVTVTHPRIMEACSAQQFLSDMLMGDDLASASASPLALLDSGVRYRSCTPIPIASLRLHKNQIHRIAALQRLYPWKRLLRDLQQGRQPALAALLKQRQDPSEPTEIPPAKSNIKMQEARAAPNGGDSITPLIWEICFDLHDSGKRVTARSVMAILKKLATNTPKQHPLVSTSAGGVKYELEGGDQKELDSDLLTGRIKNWRAKFPESSSASPKSVGF